MSPKKKTKLQRGRKSRANKVNLKKQRRQQQTVAALLQKLEQEEQAE